MYPDPAGPQVGDPIVNFLLSDRRGDTHAPRTPGIAGRLSLIVLLGDPDDPTTVAEIEACRVHAAGYAECGCALVAICQAASDRLPDVDGFIMLADTAGEVPAGFGIGGPAGRRLPMGFLVDAASRVLAVFGPEGGSGIAGLVLPRIESDRPDPSVRILGQVAPVLMLPRVFEDGFCDELMVLWSTACQKRTGVARPGETWSYTDQGADYKSRVDHQITDQDWIKRIHRRLTLRIIPEIEKIHFFNATRLEHLRIGCYDAASGGHFAMHRDNTFQEGLHRRFALTLNLNDDYDGGCLVFPEYGNHLYRPRKGEALVFSCSVLHQVTPVTAGRRFVLITFFFGEAEYQARKAARSA